MIKIEFIAFFEAMMNNQINIGSGYKHIGENFVSFINKDAAFRDYVYDKWCQRIGKNAQFTIRNPFVPGMVSALLEDISTDLFGDNVFDKEEFIAIMEDIEHIERIDEQINELYRKPFHKIETDFLCSHHGVETQLVVSALTKMYFDNTNNIDYFCWEIDFGKEEPCIWFEKTDNREQISIVLRTPADLYELLIYDRWLQKNKE